MNRMNKRSLSFGVDEWTFLDKENTWVLSGWAGRLALNKERGRLAFSSTVETVSPSFNVNDAGFQYRSDAVRGLIGLWYVWPDPTRFTRDAVVFASLHRGIDYSGNVFSSGVFALSQIQFLNYYTAFTRLSINPETVRNMWRTRGGPLTLEPGGMSADLFLSSDQRKMFVVRMGLNMRRGGSGSATGLNTNIELKVAPNVALTLSPSVSWGTEEAQWVGAFDDMLATRTFGKRYVFAKPDQVTLASSARLNWTFTPKLSFQLYAQPFVAVGDYSEYKELARSQSYDFVRYGEGGSAFDAATLVADPDGPGGSAETIQLPNRDFNVASLRGTAVMRWEYRPGSTLYLVWTQRRSDFTNDPYFEFGSSFDQLATAPMENVFAVKMNWWLSL